MTEVKSEESAVRSKEYAVSTRHWRKAESRKLKKGT
jgi:hypothetical protein